MTNLVVIQIEDLEKIINNAVTKAMEKFQRPDEALKVKDVAKILSYSEKEIYLLMKQGKLRHIKKGINGYRVPRSAIDEFLQTSSKKEQEKRQEQFSEFNKTVEIKRKIGNVKKENSNVEIIFNDNCKAL